MVTWPWMFGGDVVATVIVPAAPVGPKRPAIVPLNVLMLKLLSSAIGNGPAYRLTVGENCVVR